MAANNMDQTVTREHVLCSLGILGVIAARVRCDRLNDKGKGLVEVHLLDRELSSVTHSSSNGRVRTRSREQQTNQDRVTNRHRDLEQPPKNSPLATAKSIIANLWVVRNR
jgi:hypothetical protein